MTRLSLPTRRAHYPGGSDSALKLSRPAQALHVLRLARSLSCPRQPRETRLKGAQREHKLRPKPARQSPTLLMSGEGKRSDWPSLKPPRPSSALLARSFVCECHTISAVPRFQPRGGKEAP